MYNKDTLHKTPIRKGDQVKILSGKDNGKIGEVICVSRKKWAVKVKDMSMATKHIKKQDDKPGTIARVERWIDISNVSYYCPIDKMASKIIRKEGKRVVKKTNRVIGEADVK